MSWAVGYDNKWKRDIGYGVPATCDHPECNAEINRGLSYVCGGEPYGGALGCGLYFCPSHLSGVPQLCEQCAEDGQPFTPKPNIEIWIRHKLTDESWREWREDNPDGVYGMKQALGIPIDAPPGHR